MNISFQPLPVFTEELIVYTEVGMFIFFLIAFLLGSVFYFWWLGKEKGAPFVSLSPAVVERVMKIGKIKKRDIFYDLGSGDGRLVIAAAMKGAKAYGVEKDFLRVIYSRLWIRLLRLEKSAKIIHEDLFKVNLKKATVVHLFLLQSTNDKIEAKLKKSCFNRF